MLRLSAGDIQRDVLAPVLRAFWTPRLVSLMWQAACRALPSERWFVVVTASVIHAVTLWGFCALFYALEAAAACRRHKIPRRPAAVRGLDELNGRALREQVLGTCVVVPLAVWLVYPLMRWRGIVVCAPEYSGGGGGDGDGMAAGDWWRLAKDVARLVEGTVQWFGRTFLRNRSD